MASANSFKKIKITDDVDRGGRGLIESLPGDILVDIFSRLPISCLARLMFVCRSWRSILTQHSRFSSSPTKPCLLLHCDYPIRNVLHFLDLSEEEKRITTKKLTLRFLSSMPEFDVVGSCNGLLCLYSLFNDSVYLYNPFTTNSLELPECSNKYHDQELVFGFGYHKKTKEYKVVKIVYFGGRSIYRSPGRIEYKKSEVQILTLSSRTDQSLSWRSLGEAPYKFVKRSSEALVNGRLHFVTRPSSRGPKFVSFDLEDEEFREISKPDCGGLNRNNLRLVSLKGCLCAVVYGIGRKFDIWVMKSYGVKESWGKEYSVKTYLPRRLKQKLDRPKWTWKTNGDGNAVRVLCALENGEILLEYKSRALVAYDPIVGTFKDLLFHGLPNWFHTVVHVGTLSWFDTPLDSM